VIDTETGTILGIAHLFNADEFIGGDLFLADQSREIHARFQRTVPVHLPPLPDQTVVTHDYELFGSIAVEVTDG